MGTSPTPSYPDYLSPILSSHHSSSTGQAKASGRQHLYIDRHEGVDRTHDLPYRMEATSSNPDNVIRNSTSERTQVALVARDGHEIPVEHVTESIQLINDDVKSVRAICSGLRPGVLDDLDFSRRDCRSDLVDDRAVMRARVCLTGRVRALTACTHNAQRSR